MPLTPAEVHNVAFKKPPIGKRGYDEEEVDAFLDIVEVELSRLIEENNGLKARPGAGAIVANGGARFAELAAVRDDNGRLQARIGELEKALTHGKDGAQHQLVQVQQQLAQTEQQLAQTRQQLQQAQLAAQQAQQAAQAAQAAQQTAVRGGGPSMSNEHHSQAVQMLALAQQTADQHLAQSKTEAERLLAEAQADAHASLTNAQTQSDKHLAEAKARAEQIERESSAKAAQAVQEADQRAASITAQFEQRRAALERRVEELRTFEREYRTRLKSYLESQLRDLDASGRAEPVVPQEGQRAQA